jgi:hypothetical protein
MLDNPDKPLVIASPFKQFYHIVGVFFLRVVVLVVA